ncbi:MAG: phospholipid/cholesterol/gamma-HCH transport system substrate-binding protein [Solirubrobacteraceae bacterium]|nr:phospholipid/cholesterol/gamma-HCH transport system substrate-binding protein [Solirubrobacteraceae bacterium]
MRNAIGKYSRDFAALILLFVVGLGVGGYILSNQRFYLPKWVPIVGSDFVDYKAEFSTGKSLTPGQGQTVDIAGVPVGEIGDVNLVNGRAVVTMKIEAKYAPIYKDATALLRPKTGLEDMIVELTPGSKTAGKAEPGYVIPVQDTLPDVKLDEVLAQLDTDTRDYLKLLVAGAGQGLRDNGKNLSAGFRRFDPTARDLAKLSGRLSKRRVHIRNAIHNFRLVIEALGQKDKQLTELVGSSNVVFRTLAQEDSRLRDALQQLPPTLRTTNTALGKADTLAKVLGPTLQGLRPAARALGPTLRETRPFLRATTPIIRDQLRPFARDARPTVKLLRPAARDLAAATPDLTKTFKVVNYLLNELTYNPAGSEEGYLFWIAWANHAGNSIFQTQDAHGPIRHGLFLTSCSTLGVLDTISKANPVLGTLSDLLNRPATNTVCPTTSQAPGSGGG